MLVLIEGYLQKAADGGGFYTLSQQEADELEKLSLLAERYEDEDMKLIPRPVTLSAVVEAKKEELCVTQKGLASTLEIGAPKLSQIRTGKQEPDIAFLKAVHEKLNIDAEFLLTHA